MGRSHISGAGAYKFLLLRTRLSVDLSDEALRPLAAAILRDHPKPNKFSSPQRFLFPGSGEDDEFTWDDGIIIRFADQRSCSQLATDLASELSAFDAWAIHDCCDEWIEHPSGGPLARYFSAPERTGAPSAMLFLCDHNHTRDPDSLSGQVRDRLAGSAAVFYFRDGRVLLAPRPDPFRVLINRIGDLSNRYVGFAGCDANGTFFNRGQEDGFMWEDVEEIDDLDFEA